jgi:hypothetical protein
MNEKRWLRVADMAAYALVVALVAFMVIAVLR